MSIYDGKNKDWTWEMHLASLRDYFEYMECSGQEQEEGMKVKMLMASIQCEDLCHLSTLGNIPSRQLLKEGPAWTQGVAVN